MVEGQETGGESGWRLPFSGITRLRQRQVLHIESAKWDFWVTRDLLGFLMCIIEVDLNLGILGSSHPKRDGVQFAPNNVLVIQ